MANRIVRGVSTKRPPNEGGWSEPYPIGALFENIIDTESGGITLKQFFDAYLSFIEEVNLFHYGNSEPTNSHMQIWIDTSETNGL